jgi:uncharacterized protein YhjY with autotransporter beta-barrel domain
MPSKSLTIIGLAALICAISSEIAAGANLTIISGNNQQGLLGQSLGQPLVVELVGQVLVSPQLPVGPIYGAAVQWRVTKGQAQLEPESRMTDAQGRASTNVITLGSVGVVDVEASAAGLSVTFTLSSTTSFEKRAEDLGEGPIGKILDGICARSDPMFSSVCAALSKLSTSDLPSVLEHIAPQESGVESKVATEVASAVTSAIEVRLATLRTHRSRTLRSPLMEPSRSALSKAFLSMSMASSAAGDEDGDDKGLSAYLSGNLGSGKRIARIGQLGFDLDSHGLMAGVDRQSGDNIFGVSLNLMKLDAALNDEAGSVGVTAYALSVYASRDGLLTSGARAAGSGMYYDGVHIDGSLTLSRNRYASEHVVDIPGLSISRAASVNNASLFTLAGATGLEAHSGRSEFEASLSGSWSRTRIGDLAENGSGPLILFVQGHEIDSLLATGSFSVRSARSLPFGTLFPYVRGEMIHEFKSAARLVTARFLHDSFDTSFTIPIDRPDANYGKVAAGLLSVFTHGISAYVDVTQYVFRSDLKFRTVQLNVNKSF